MSNMKNMIAAAAAAIALSAPLVGTAHAKPNGFKAVQPIMSAEASPVQLARARGYDRRRGSVFTPRIDRRIAAQSARIRHGRARGRLTQIEAIRLNGRLFSIRSVRRFARLDGRVTHVERARLHAMLDVNEDLIRRLSRNGRRS